MKERARWTAVRRGIGLALLATLFVPPAAIAADEITVLSGGGARRARVLLVEGPGGPEAAIEDATASLDLTFARSDGRVTIKGRRGEVTLENGRSLFSVGGQLKALPAPPRVVGSRVYLSPAGVAVVLNAVLGEPASWRAPFRTLVIGAFDAPRLLVSSAVSPESVAVTLEFSRRVAVSVRRDAQRVTLDLAADIVDTAFKGEPFAGRIVDDAHFEAKAPPAVSFSLGERFSSLKTSEEEGPPYRFRVEFQASSPASSLASPGGTRTPLPAISPVERFQRPFVVVIDPGHGGSDTGARGPGGRLEKDLALVIARRLRTAVVDSLGGQAYLTRDGDDKVPALDDRAAIANNFNADVFISLHANGSRASQARGTEVFFLSYTAVDDESRRLAQAEGAIAQSPAPGDDVGLILWDMAQAAHLEASESLAALLQTEISRAAGTPMRGVKQAPFRVLVGATMPAVLVEMGFITNPEDEKLLASEAHQARIVEALVRGLGRFLRERAR
jgi:N-acetylmuramoyl-L-alanine amidase